jgi:CBS domain-containing protein
MNVGQICSRNLIRAPRSMLLLQAAVLMRQHHVGALLVTDEPAGDPRVVGIVTDRDLVLRAMAMGIGPGEASLGDVLAGGLATIEGEAGLRDAVETMRREGVRRLGVTDDRGELVGLVSFDDIVDAIAARLAQSAVRGNDLAVAAEMEALAGILRTERLREQDGTAAAPFAP